MDAKSEKLKLNRKAYSSGSSVKKLGTEILAENLTICAEWNLSIDLKLPSRLGTEMRSIFSLYAKNNTGQLGQLVLTASIRPDQSNVELIIAYKLDDKSPINSSKSRSQNNRYNITKKVNESNWIQLKISQMNEVYEINLDSELVFNKKIRAAKTWKNVKLVTGKAREKDKISTVVYYRSFKINTCKARGKSQL